MCGIIGVASGHPIGDCSWLRKGRDVMAHRGPDDAGEMWLCDGRVGFGHRRLSIIDLSAAGHQPMLDNFGELSIVFNGEIYNYRELREYLIGKGHTFFSRADTEVILAAYREWGKDCPKQLEGMFSFVLYDGRRHILFGARDRTGEKPLFYSLRNGTFSFASELKALMADPAFPRRIEPEALNCYLTMGYVPGSLCIFDSTKKLPPAHAMQFSLQEGTSKIWKYWELPEFVEGEASEPADQVELLDELETLLEDSVRQQLAADVPVGVLLSGGVDSSLMATMAVRASPNVKTFTVGFAGHEQHDETQHARLVAQHFATEHIELEASNASVDLMPLLARQFDEPIGDSSMIPTYLVSQLVSQYCSVALGGDGGDELFGGYNHYDRLLWLGNRSDWLPGFLGKLISTTSETILPIGFRGRNWLRALNKDFDRELPLIATFFDDTSRKRLLKDSEEGDGPLPCHYTRRYPKHGSVLERATRADFENYLPEDILVKVDRASMLNSLEVRSPFLDTRIINFAFTKVPTQLKVTSRERKILLKRLAYRTLPGGFDFQRKQGFTIPLDKWLKSGPWRDFFKDTLLGTDDGIFENKYIKRLFNMNDKGYRLSEHLFLLTILELWRNEYSVTI